MNFFDVIILSTGNRGASLANQLSSTKKVAVIRAADDCALEDLEGPFGFFLESDRPQNWVESSSGFSIKTLDKSFYFKNLFLSSVYEKRVEYQNLLSNHSVDFKQTWLRKLIGQLKAGVEVCLNQDKVNENLSFIFNDFGLLQYVSQNFNKSISVFSENGFCFNKKLNYFSHPSIGDIRGENIICLLNPEEMRQFEESVYHMFFKNYVQPYWCWRRLTFEFEDESYPVPLYLVLADPENIPWTHERLICLKRSLFFENRIELWVKIPYSICDCEESVQKITATLQSYFPNFKWICQSKNWTTPACLFPIYSKEGMNCLHFKSNVHYGWSAEDLSPNGFLKREKNILKSLLKGP